MIYMYHSRDHSQHTRVRVKLNFTCKEVVKTRVALYTKVIDGVCHCMYMTKTCVCNSCGLYVSHVCPVKVVAGVHCTYIHTYTYICTYMCMYLLNHIPS